MSHFSVLVIGENPENQLLKFQQNTGDMDGQWPMVFDDITNQLRKQYETESTEYIIMPDGRKLLPWDDEFRVPGSIGFAVGREPSHRPPENLERRQIPAKEIYKSFEEYARDWHGMTPNAEGRYGYWQNPEAKWDWYQLGGRFLGAFKLKEPVSYASLGASGAGRNAPIYDADQARKKDIDFEGMRKADRDRYGKFFDESKGMDPDRRFLMYNIKPGMSREDYIEAHAGFRCFAVVKDGHWYERGSMGWWGVVSDEQDPNEWITKVNELIAGIPDETLLSLYDCHI